MDHIIIVALERLSRVLRAMLWEHAKQEGLSPIQIQFLVYIAAHSKKYSSVSEIARTFRLTPATVSDAITVLEEKGLIQKIVSRRDRRKYPLTLTRQGQHLSQRLKNWYQPMLALVHQFPVDMREAGMRFLLQLLEAIPQSELREEFKTCLLCEYFEEQNPEKQGDSPHCILRNVSLNHGDFRLNCPNYKHPIPM